MRPEVKEDGLRRLTYIEGHLAGVRRMLQEEKYCVDILHQTHAVRKAIEKLEALLLENHLHTCVVQGVRDGRAEQVVQELLGLYNLSAGA